MVQEAMKKRVAANQSVLTWPERAPFDLSTLTSDPIPLVFDLDGTLINGDSSMALWRAALKAPFRQKLRSIRFSGLDRDHVILAFKDWALKVVQQFDLAMSDLSFRPDVVAFAQAAAEVGRPLWLVSGSMNPVVEYFAERLNLEHEIQFACVRGSDWPTNLIGHKKAKWLLEHASHGFDYIGDNPIQDHFVWKWSRYSYLAATEV